ncbi:F0F1 ATP synthase subunit delta [Candidatus Daviesbacteria bacterium]|nr:F0F1 ATP synthase subunit delta [Candidatus Daviesbacteria bacterium]
MTLELTLAYQPTHNQTKQIQDWFKENFDKKVSLAISVDKSLIAGAVIAYQGRIYDYSYAKRVEEVYESLQELS